MRFSLAFLRFTLFLSAASRLDVVGAFSPPCNNVRSSNPPSRVAQTAYWQPAKPHSTSQFSWTRLGSSTTDDDEVDDEIVAIDGADQEESATEETTAETDADEPTNDKAAEEPTEEAPVEEAVEEEEVDEPTPAPLSKAEMMENLLFLQSLATITSRGEYASKAQKNAIETVVAKLEASNPTPEPTIATKLIQGTWELVLANNGQLFRSSPFFMAGRAVCSTPEQAQQYDWFCSMHRKALAISNIVAVRQIVSRSRLVSEFEVKAGAIPFLNDFTPFSYSGGLPVTIDGAIVSTADLMAINTTTWELFMDTVEIKGSNLPGIRQVLDSDRVKLQSRQLGGFLEDNLPSYSNPKPLFRTTFLNEQFRISRDQDDNIFVYVKTSDDTEPTDYSYVDADLGVARLLEGFNDAITRFYM